MPTRTGTYGVTDDICEERRRAIIKDFEKALAHEREMREQEMNVRDSALVSQAAEYERRLTDLNHNLRMMLDDRKTYVTREVFETFVTAHRQFRDEVLRHQTTVATWGAAAVFALGILQLAVHFFLK